MRGRGTSSGGLAWGSGCWGFGTRGGIIGTAVTVLSIDSFERVDAELGTTTGIFESSVICDGDGASIAGLIFSTAPAGGRTCGTCIWLMASTAFRTRIVGVICCWPRAPDAPAAAC